MTQPRPKTISNVDVLDFSATARIRAFLRGSVKADTAAAKAPTA